MGNVYSDIDHVSFRFRQQNLQDFNYMVHAFGFGIRYRTPVGPIRVDFSLSPNSPRFFGFSGTRDQLLTCTPSGPNACVLTNQRINVFQFHFSSGKRPVHRRPIYRNIIAAVIAMNSLAPPKRSTGSRSPWPGGHRRERHSAGFARVRVPRRQARGLEPAAKRRSAGRLVDQILILQEAADSHVTLSIDEELDKTLAQVKAQFGSAPEYQAALARYGITEKDVSAQLAAGLRTLRFTDLRFRPEVQIGDQDLRAYYDQLAAGWRAKNEKQVPSFESSRDQVEQLLTEQRLNEALDRWLAQTRNETQIVYRVQVVP